MAEKKKPAAKAAPKSATSFSAEERDAMKERAAENKRGKKGDGEADILAKISEMGEPDKGLATRIHAIVRKAAPELECKTWYGMPAYARAGKVVCFFQNAAKFKTRYSTLGFNEEARLDDGNVWPIAYAVTSLTADDEKRIAQLVKQAVS